jgi:hypothetical protein
MKDLQEEESLGGDGEAIDKSLLRSIDNFLQLKSAKKPQIPPLDSATTSNQLF